MNIDEAIEMCRPTSGTNAHMFPDEWARYELFPLQEMKRLGMTDTSNVLSETWNLSEQHRYTCWLYEAIVFSIEQIRRVEKDPTDTMSLRAAFRGCLQIKSYQGRLRQSLGENAANAIQAWLLTELAPL